MSSVNANSYDIAGALDKEGLKARDYAEICRRLKRHPNRVELGMFGVMWSEHCCYRNSKSLLNLFPTTGPRILVGPGENAGVVDLDQGQRLVFKIESHNHPSAIEPFQGAATGVGGILRDIFTMGARPIALLNALRFGPLEDKKNVSLLEGVVKGIAHYGNCVGVPTVGGEVSFDSSYSGNPLVNAMALGLMETKDIVCSGASGIDFPVLYVGSTTGRDGMGGASFASSELTKASLDNRPAVQVGDPFLEKGLIEACLEVFKSGHVVAAQDMGAAGLTCSCSEMAANGSVGIELNLDLVPARETGMSAYEFLLSESQERMLFVVKPGSEEFVMDKFIRWGLNAVVVGRVLEEKVVRVIHKNEIVANIPANALANDTPIEEHELIKGVPDEINMCWLWKENKLPQPEVTRIKSASSQKIYLWSDVLLKLLDNPTISSKRWIYNQYDHQVQLNTVVSPGCGDAAVVRIRPQEFDNQLKEFNRGIAAVVDCPNRWVSLDPQRGSIAAVAEAARNISCVGAEPIAITNNLNFQSPETPLGYWKMYESCKGISKACEAFKTPVTGGNVSLYNETRMSDGSMQPIHPTPVIGMVGIVENLSQICRSGWHQAGDSIWMLGVPLELTDSLDNRISLSATAYLETIHGLVTGRPPKPDLELEYYLQTFLRKSIRDGFINSAHDISDGGLAVALAECSINSNLGVQIDIPLSNSRIDRLLFAEGGSRVLVSVPANKNIIWRSYIENYPYLNNMPLPASPIGYVSSDSQFCLIQGEVSLLNLSVNTLRDSFEQAIPRRLAVEK